MFTPTFVFSFVLDFCEIWGISKSWTREKLVKLCEPGHVLDIADIVIFVDLRLLGFP